MSMRRGYTANSTEKLTVQELMKSSSRYLPNPTWHDKKTGEQLHNEISQAELKPLREYFRGHEQWATTTSLTRQATLQKNTGKERSRKFLVNKFGAAFGYKASSLSGRPLKLKNEISAISKGYIYHVNSKKYALELPSPSRPSFVQQVQSHVQTVNMMIKL